MWLRQWQLIFPPSASATRFDFRPTPFAAGQLLATGRVGDAISPEEAQALAAQCALNALAAAAAVVGGVDNLAAVSHVTGFVSSTPTFSVNLALLTAPPSC